MAVSMRACAGAVDFPLISEFLQGLYQTDNSDGNWFQPVWEYAYTHPWFDMDSVSCIGIWEDRGRVVAVVQYESRPGEAFFQVAPGYEYLKPEMLAYAETHLAAAAEETFLNVYVTDFDKSFEDVVRCSGYERYTRDDRPMSQFTIPSSFPIVTLPEGFRLQSLADDNDLVKVNRLLWRGFNHPGEPPPDGVEKRKLMQSGPNFRKDLTIVAVAPSGDFASLAGLWYDQVNRFGYVEPVATDPGYRRMGLGRAALFEGIRRCGELGATVAYVGSDLPFYLSNGFRKLFTYNCWSRKGLVL